jgi:hypothetical protein
MHNKYVKLLYVYLSYQLPRYYYTTYKNTVFYSQTVQLFLQIKNRLDSRHSASHGLACFHDSCHEATSGLSRSSLE